jgi:hypothetical protein
MARSLEGFQILIPTRGRVEQQTTLRSLPPALRIITTLVAPKDEVWALSKHQEAYLNSRVVVQPSSITNIAEKRAWMMKWARDKWPRVVMIDDDCYFFARCPVKQRQWNETKLYWEPLPGAKLLSVEHATSKKLESTFMELNELLAKYAHAGMSSRNGNHTEKREVMKVGRMMHCIGYDTETFAKKVKTKNRVLVREDFDYTLQLLRAGHENAIIFHTCVSPGGYGAKGGCSDERTRELSNREAQKLVDLHPGLVKLRNGVVRYRPKDQEFKNSNEESDRLEVTVYWRKALSKG